MPQHQKYQFSCVVAAQYIPQQSSPVDSIYGFAYTVTITNTGQVTAQLISRHWEIVDANVHVEEVKGLGVWATSRCSSRESRFSTTVARACAPPRARCMALTFV